MNHVCTYKLLKRQAVSDSQKQENRKNSLAVRIGNIPSLSFLSQIPDFGLAKPQKNEGRDHMVYK